MENAQSAVNRARGEKFKSLPAAAERYALLEAGHTAQNILRQAFPQGGK
jgi:hypothetical protein